jgi:hypothetical protein
MKVKRQRRVEVKAEGEKSQDESENKIKAYILSVNC